MKRGICPSCFGSKANCSGPGARRTRVMQSSISCVRSIWRTARAHCRGSYARLRASLDCTKATLDTRRHVTCSHRSAAGSPRGSRLRISARPSAYYNNGPQMGGPARALPDELLCEGPRGPHRQLRCGLERPRRVDAKGAGISQAPLLRAESSPLAHRLDVRGGLEVEVELHDRPVAAVITLRVLAAA